MISFDEVLALDSVKQLYQDIDQVGGRTRNHPAGEPGNGGKINQTGKITEREYCQMAD